MNGERRRRHSGSERRVAARARRLAVFGRRSVQTSKRRDVNQGNRNLTTLYKASTTRQQTPASQSSLARTSQISQIA